MDHFEFKYPDLEYRGLCTFKRTVVGMWLCLCPCVCMAYLRVLVCPGHVERRPARHPTLRAAPIMQTYTTQRRISISG